MLSRLSKGLDRKVHRTRFQNVLQEIDGNKASRSESDPISQLLPEASHDEAPFSGSLNVSMKWKEKIVDVSLCDEASSDLPKTSEAPRCDEAPSSSSSSSGLIISKFDLISSIRKDLGKVEDFNLDDLIHLLRKLRDMENHQKASSLGHFPGPDDPGLQKTKEIVSKQDIRRSVQTFLKQIGSAHVATVGLLVVARSLERFYPISTNREKCWHLLKEMYDLAIVLKRLRESAEGMQDVMQEATSLIIEGALLCSTQIVRSAFSRFFSTSPLEFEGALSNIRQKLNAMYMKINTEIALRGLTLIEHQGRSPLSKEYPTRAGNGQVEKDLLLTVEEDVPELEDEDIPELEDEDMPELEDAYMPELEEAYIHTPQVEEDLPEPQKAYIRFVCLIIMYAVVYNAIFWKYVCSCL